MDIRVAGGASNVVGDVAVDVHAKVCPGLVSVVVLLAISLGENGVNADDPRASNTELLMAASVGRWFIGLSVGLSSSHARCAFASSFLYARKSARVVVVGGMGR